MITSRTLDSQRFQRKSKLFLCHPTCPYLPSRGAKCGERSCDVNARNAHRNILQSFKYESHILLLLLEANGVYLLVNSKTQRHWATH